MRPARFVVGSAASLTYGRTLARLLADAMRSGHLTAS
jgi:hypothetical protein